MKITCVLLYLNALNIKHLATGTIHTLSMVLIHSLISEVILISHVSSKFVFYYLFANEPNRKCCTGLYSTSVVMDCIGHGKNNLPPNPSTKLYVNNTGGNKFNFIFIIANMLLIMCSASNRRKKSAGRTEIHSQNWQKAGKGLRNFIRKNNSCVKTTRWIPFLKHFLPV